MDTGDTFSPRLNETSKQMISFLLVSFRRVIEPSLSRCLEFQSSKNQSNNNLIPKPSLTHMFKKTISFLNKPILGSGLMKDLNG